MLVCIEGAPGSGKSTLVRLLAQMFPCHAVYEDAERNPFLHDYYHLPAQERGAIAEHVQYTFLFLQDWQLRTHLALAGKKTLVLTDFHPLKSLVFSQIILPPDKREPLHQRYENLQIQQPDLLIHLEATEDILLSRIRKRRDRYMYQIDMPYVGRILEGYTAFLRTYQGAALTIDNSHLDYVKKPQDFTKVVGLLAGHAAGAFQSTQQVNANRMPAKEKRDVPEN